MTSTGVYSPRTLIPMPKISTRVPRPNSNPTMRPAVTRSSRFRTHVNLADVRPKDRRTRSPAVVRYPTVITRQKTA